MLDLLGRHFYKPRAIGGAVVATALIISLQAKGEVVNGVQLPDGSQKVGENRFRVPQDYEDTLKYYRTVYPAAAYPRRPIVNQPGVKAVHIVNPSAKNFEGLNIYEANEEVRIFIVTAETKPAKKKPEPAKPSPKKSR